jgi:hypothetical protein
MSNEQQKTNWYNQLIQQTNTMSEAFGLDDSQTNELRNFIVSLARDQYKVGNKSGAAWAFQQARENPTAIRPQPQMAT